MLIIISCMMILVGMAGCIGDENKFEGTWRTQPIAGISIGFTFRSDGTLTIEGTETSLGMWEINDGKLIISSDADESVKVTGTFSYEFSDDNKEVSLTQKGTTITLRKD